MFTSGSPLDLSDEAWQLLPSVECPTRLRHARRLAIPAESQTSGVESEMAERALELASRFEQANAELAALIESCSEEQWRALCKDEGWSVGVTAHHVAYDQDPIVNWLTAIATGQQPSPRGDELEGHAESLDARNARHAKDYASCTRAETLDLLRGGGAVAAAAVRALSDEQLDRAVQPDGPAGRSWTAEEVVEEILIGHVLGHMASLREAIGSGRIA